MTTVGFSYQKIIESFNKRDGDNEDIVNSANLI